MERNDCGGGAIPRPPGFEPSPECLRDSGMRGLNFAVQMTAAILIVGFFIARSFAKWAVSSPIRAEDCVSCLPPFPLFPPWRGTPPRFSLRPASLALPQMRLGLWLPS